MVVFLERGLADALFAHARNLVIATVIMGAGAHAVRRADDMPFASVVNTARAPGHAGKGRFRTAPC